MKENVRNVSEKRENMRLDNDLERNECVVDNLRNLWF